MSKPLIIVESPTKAKTISRFLGGQYQVEASMGHVRDLPKSKLSIDVKHDFEPVYIIPPKAKELIAKLKALAKRTWAIVLATIKAAGRADYIRVTEEVNKDQIITDYLQKVVTNEQLKPLGVMVDQDEAFFVEVKLSEMETRTAVAA